MFASSTSDFWMPWMGAQATGCVWESRRQSTIKGEGKSKGKEVRNVAS